MPRKIALVGVGKIAREQHAPAIEASSDWELAATVSRSGHIDGREAYHDLEAMIAARPDIDAVSLCMPPVPRFAYAQTALMAGLHVMLEKPPGATLGEVHELHGLAREHGLTLFAAWHSRLAGAVGAAREWLSSRTVMCAHVNWREDIRQHRADQSWLFEPGGMGVFDPGSDALAILSHILPEPVHMTWAELDIPANQATAIAARLSFSGGISAEFDWRHHGDPSQDMDFDTDDGQMSLRRAGREMWVDGELIHGPDEDSSGYPALYERLDELTRAGDCDVDLAPMLHIADAHMLGRRIIVEPFSFDQLSVAG